MVHSAGPYLRRRLWGPIIRIRITSTTDVAITDSSDANFAIIDETPSTITVISPNGGESWARGTAYTLTWISTGSPGADVKIELLKGNTVNLAISSSTENDGSFSWTIPPTQTLGADYRIRITSTTDVAITDSSDANFAIVGEGLTVTSPSGGESWVSGTAHEITWTSTGSPTAYVRIELVKPGVANRVLVSSTPNDGSFGWVIPLTQALGSDYRVKVTRTTYPVGSTAATDSSDANFAIVGEGLTVTSPSGGESWVSGTAHEITWTSTGSPTAYVRIELVKPGVANRVLVSSTPNDGSFGWVIPLTQALGSDYRVKVTRTTYPVGSTAATDSSDANFAIVGEGLTVTSPSGGESWVSGTAHEITWTSTGSPTAYVRIELVKPGVANRVLVSSTPNDGSFGWVIPLTQALGSDYRVKVTRTTYPVGSTAATDSSDANFAIVGEGLTVTSPSGGESWVSGTAHEITWTSTGSPTAYVRIELVKPGVANRVLVSSTPNDGSFGWVIPLTQALGSDYRVKVTRTTYPVGSTAATDSSDANFAIVGEGLTVTSPSGGESWVSGTAHEITWTSTGSPTAYVRIELVKPGVANRVSRQQHS